jgi:DNA-binding response OmpR family regulator
MMVNPIKILLADDNTNEYIFFKHALSKASIPTHIYPLKGGIQVLQYLADPNSALTDIFFLDINMPMKNGKECLAAIRENEKFAHLPVVMYSTSDTKSDIDESYELGADLYLIKPAELDDLKIMLSHVIEKYTKNELKRPERSSFTLHANSLR